MPNHQLLGPLIESLTRAGYPEDELEAFREGFTRARGRYPDKFHAAWGALNRRRTYTNRVGAGQPGVGPQEADSLHTADQS